MSGLLLALVAAATFSAAQAAPSKTAPPPAQGNSPLAGLSMDQQMELCDRLQTMQKQMHSLTPQMKQQLQACRVMTMGDTRSDMAPDATLDR
ncbi:hypothetical protein [Gluconobacter morbifer]|uniref:hypothetical protein n=1 Tax=Gluconobacter morbifer TaxID=479935 RepID=UPI00058E0302|nr:hypothetical protein [Gluconobacter morbifer]